LLRVTDGVDDFDGTPLNDGDDVTLAVDDRVVVTVAVTVRLLVADGDNDKYAVNDAVGVRDGEAPTDNDAVADGDSVAVGDCELVCDGVADRETEGVDD
jgi:hypothetical protein